MMRKVCNMIKAGVTVLFALVMIVGGICFMGADVNEVYAASSSVKDSTGYNKENGYFVKEYEEISTYKTTDTYPILDGAEYADAQDWLFAGWYTTDTCETSIGTAQEGEAWAKFVHIDVLSVKCQIEKGTYAGTNKTNMRLISTLDSLKYDTVGFKVRYSGGAELDFPVSKVFKRINASEINGNECGYSPAAFHETSEYFMTYSLLNIANKNFSKPFYIEPYWITLDGTEVSGASRFARVEDQYLKIVNVPVRLHQDANVTSGSATVNYNIVDSNEVCIYEPYTIDDVIQYDNGNVFDAVTVATNDDTKTITVTATEQTEAVKANGMLVNLRFQMIADGMPSTSTFDMTSDDFNVSDFVFKNFPLTYEGGHDISWYQGYEDSDTFAISSVADFYGLAALTNGTAGVGDAIDFKNKVIYLASDLTINEGSPLGADGEEGTTDDWATTGPTHVWVPIGKTKSFAGTFDGQGNTINGVYVSETTDKAGLFAQTTTTSTIQDVRIESSYVSSTSKQVGSVVGYSDKTKLMNIYSDVCVKSDGMYVGGLVGYVQNASSTENISSCWFNGDVIGSSYCGGIVGCYNYGKTASIVDSLVTGTVQSTKDAENAMTGGIVGGTVNPKTYGNIKLTISSCVSVGAITVGYTSGDGYIGGVIGYRPENTDLVVENVYTIQELGIGTETGTNEEGIVANCGVDSSILNGHIAYDTIDGFSFLSSTNMEGKWVIRETASSLKDGVPIPAVFAEEWIDVEWYYNNLSEDTRQYSIGTSKELLGFSDIYNTGINFDEKTINLTRDISLNPENVVTNYVNGISSKEPDTNWRPGGSKQFAGTFDGHGHTISGIYTMTDSTNIGLFAILANGSIVKDLKITDSYFYTTNTDNAIIGSVAGECRGTIDSVYSEAIVKSKGNRVGGLVGVANGPIPSGQTIYGTATINNSWFNGSIDLLDGATNSGGIIGLTMQGNVNVSNCLVTGSINNATKKTDAGLIGYIGNAGARNMVVNISNSVVALGDEVTNTNVGNLIGTIKNNDSGTTVTRKYTIVNSYVTEESFSGDNIISDNKEDDEAAIVGEGVSQVEGSTAFVGLTLMKAEADLQGVKGYENTLLDFYVNEADSGEWVARSGKVPCLKSFVEENVESLEGISQTGWYDDDINSYYLGTVSAFKAFRDYVNTGTNFNGKTVYLADDMDLNPNWKAPKDATESVSGNPDAWTPIGTSTAKFSGTFDGQNHIIQGLYVNSAAEHAGLFGIATDNVSTIQNLRINNSYVYSSAKNVGSVIGYAQRTKLMNIYSDAYVKGDNRNVGGLVGYVKNASTAKDISNCWFDGTAMGTQYCGGIVGCYNYGKTARIANSLFTGTVHTTLNNKNAQTGGIVGGTDNPTAYKNIVLTFSSCISAGTITESYAQGAGLVGGVIGYRPANTDLIIENVYTTEASGIGTDSDTNKETDTTNVITNEENLYGLGAYMLTKLDFTSPKWAARRGQLPAPAELVADSDKLTIGDLGKADTSWLDDETNNGLSEDTPYIIDSVEELYGFAILSQTDNFEGKYIKLGADIDVNPDELATNWAGGEVATLPWYTIGVAEDGLRFAGVFDGDNHTISGIYLKQSKDYLGLFAAIEENAVVKNLRLENSYIEQTGSGATGSIIGDCRGTVDNVYSDAIIIASANYAGGIVACANGFSYKSDEANEEARTARTISNCWYDGTINMKKQFCGGIIGGIVQGEWTLTNCVFTGNINSLYKGEGAYAYAGGICGDIAAPAHEYGLDDTTVTSDTPSKLVVNSCISTGTIKTAVYDKGAGAIVGRMRTTDSQISILKMTNVFASREAGWSEVGSSASGATVEGAAVWTNSADRLVGFCTEKTVAGYYDGGSLNYSEEFVLREEGVPVPKTFEDMTNKVATIEVAELDELLCLSTMDTTWTTEAAVNNGLGHYVLRTTEVEYTDFTTYLGALKDNGFKAYIALPGDTSEGVVAHVDEDSANDGVYNVIYRRAAGEWIVNVLFVQNTNSVTLTISNGFDSLSPDLVPKATVTEGTVSLSMLQLIGSGTDYYYGNSFVFKLPTGKFVIVDGGNNDDSDDDVDNGDFTGLVSYLQGLQEDSTKPVEIQAWVVTHQHGDHFDLVREFVDNADAVEGLRVNALYINEPSREAMLCNAEDGDVMKTVRQQYRGIRMLQDVDGNPTKVYWCQTGQKYYFDGLTMDVIQSQEQIEVKNYGPYNAGAVLTGKKDFNTASMNLLFTTTNDKKVFITGDSNQVNMEYIMNMYGENSKMLENINVYQVPHHGKNTSYKVNVKDNAFTDYLAGLVTENAITAGKFDVALFPCSLFYGIDYTDLMAFPVARDANSHLINEKSTSAYHYGNGTIVIELGDVVKKAE